MTYGQWCAKNRITTIQEGDENIKAFANGLGVTEDELERALRSDREEAILASCRSRYDDFFW